MASVKIPSLMAGKVGSGSGHGLLFPIHCREAASLQEGERDHAHEDMGNAMVPVLARSSLPVNEWVDDPDDEPPKAFRLEAVMAALNSCGRLSLVRPTHRFGAVTMWAARLLLAGLYQ